ncbi:MAG: M48 family metalloprotease [Planctomycetota bacterium]
MSHKRFFSYLVIVLFIDILIISINSCQAMGKALSQAGYEKQAKVVKAAGAAGAALAPFSVDEEVEIGRAMAARVIEASGGIYPNDTLNHYINLVGRAVAMNVTREDLDSDLYQFAIVNTDEINALAMPGGYIVITIGALKIMQSEAELAGVLAHEVVHIDEGHLISAIKTAHGAEFLSQMASIYNENNNSKLNKLLLNSSEYGMTTLYKKGLSRSCEQEADEKAVKLLAECGYYPGALKDFLNRIKEMSQQQAERQPRRSGINSVPPVPTNVGDPIGGGLLKTLTATHPNPEDRIRTIDEYINKHGLQNVAGQKLDSRYPLQDIIK